VIAFGESQYASLSDFEGYLNFLSPSASVYGTKFSDWKRTLTEAMTLRQTGIGQYTNIAIVIWLAEILWSDYFKNWKSVVAIFGDFETHFKGLMETNKDAIKCEISSYDQWLEALTILRRFGTLIDKSVYSLAYELVISNIGLKAKFVSERLNEKGWEAHGE
jgi:hypothetical protein